MSVRPKKEVSIDWSLSNFRQLEFLRACGLAHPFDGGGPKAPVARILLFGGSAGGGKLLDINTSIITPTGFKKLIDVGIGDTVFGRDGKRHTVLGESEIIHGAAWKLTFDDGSEIVAHDDHKWLTYNAEEFGQLSKFFTENMTRRNKLLGEQNCKPVPTGAVRTTQEIVDTLYVCNGTRRNHAIPVAEPLEFPERSLPIDPYIFGLRLGDGYSNKCVPDEYLCASQKQRLALLQGLMDTDGTASGSRVEFTNSSLDIVEDVKFLLNSLGVKANITSKIFACNGKERKRAYRIKCMPPFYVFRLTYKKDKQKIGVRRTGRFRYIATAERVQDVAMKCLRVSAEDNLFLVGQEMIPTHNSDALSVLAMTAALTFPGCNIGIFRREYPQLEGPGGIIMRSHELYNKLAKYHGGNRRWTFPDNSVIQFCHAKDEASVYGYQSQQFDILLIDESTQFTEFQLRYLLTRNRATVSHVVPFCAMATNPGGVSHGYHKKYFVDAGPPNTPIDVEVQPGLFEKHMFIPSRLSDNVILEDRDPGYRLTLERQPEDIRRALLEGDWTVFEGQYFREFSVHKHVIEPRPIPTHWRKFGSIDWGFAAPCAVYLHTIDPSMGRVYTYKELYVTQKRAGDMAEMVKETIGDDEIEYIKMSPDAFHERGLGTKASPGEVVAEEFTKVGLNVEPADNRRILGWQRMREFMSDAPDGEPWWQIFNTCTNLIRTIPEMVYDKSRVEDISKDCEDHGAESCRYYLFSRPSPLEGVMFNPGAAEYFRDGLSEDDDEDMDDMPQEVDGFYGM